MSDIRTWFVTLIAMVAFAGNSVLCRLALKDTNIDAASFTFTRVVSGACALWFILYLHRYFHGRPSQEANDLAGASTGSWLSALALFCYAEGFSYAYLSLSTATGALLLFGAVQMTMIGYGLWCGERLRISQIAGLIGACAGLIVLFLPGLSTPSPVGTALMLSAGAAWGIYSLRGAGAGDPTAVTSGNFLRATPMAAGLSILAMPWISMDYQGLFYAIASGALTSGLGYVIWYTALRGLTTASAAVIQLSVPVITAVGASVFLGESITLRLLISSAAILGGIALVIVRR